jgi:hypothetical protein
MTNVLINLDARVERQLRNVAAGAETRGAGAQIALEIKAQKTLDEYMALASVLLAQRKTKQIIDTIV